MASQDTTDAVYLHTVANNPQFQERCWLRFLIYAFGVAAEGVTAPVNAITAAANATLTFSSTPANITGLFVTDNTAPQVIPVGAKVASVTATTAVLDRNVIGAGVAIGDSITFAQVYHSQRMQLAGALFAKNFDLVVLSYSVLADSAVRTNCLADKTLPGGNITDSQIDTFITTIFTGLATIRSW